MSKSTAANILGLLGIMALASPVRAQLYSDKVIGSLGGRYSVGSAINGTGQATGESYTLDGHLHAFLWNGSAMVDLGTLGGTQSSGTAINASGKVTGSSTTAGDAVSHAFLWNGTTMVDLGTLGGRYSAGTGINAAGQVTGWSDIAGDVATHAFLWNGTAMVDLGTLGGTNSDGVAINANGQITGSSDIPGDAYSHAFLWNGAAMKDLGTVAGAVNMAPIAMNNTGQIVGTAHSSASPAVSTGFLWDGTKILALTVPGATASAARAINANGQVTGWATTKTDRKGSAYLWDGTSVLKMDATVLDSGITKCNQGDDINAAGLVVGELCNYGGVADSFLWNGFAMADLNNIVAAVNTGFYDTGPVFINGRGQILIQDFDGGLNILSPIPGAIALDLAQQFNSFAGCQSVAGYVSSATPAPAGGLVVSLSDTLAAASMPATVTIPAGKIGARFTIDTTPVTSEQSGVVTATLGGKSVSQDLYIRPISVSALTVTPNPVKGGNPVTGNVKLECNAAPGSITVTLSSNNPAVAKPVLSTITIPKGQSSSSFQVTTKHVTSRVKVVMTAASNGISKSANLNVNR